MARRKKRTARKTTRRRRVSGMGKLSAGNILSSVGGVLVGTAIAGILTKKLLASQSEMVQAIVPVALGVATPMFIKSEFGKFAGAGMIAVGGVKLLSKYGLAGVDDTLEVPVRIAGDDLSVIAGDDDYAMAGGYSDYAMAGDDNLSVLAGIEDDL